MRARQASAPAALRLWPGLAVGLMVALLTGCGGDDSATAPAAGPEVPDPAPLARLAFEEPVSEIDPLFVRTRSERLLSRQIFEPLSAVARAPLGLPGRRRGPARATEASAGGALWVFELRPRLRFEDGSPLDADAVIANVERWIASGVAAEELPELIAADSPRPGQVRFQLNRPVEDLPARLDSPPFGLISAPALLARGLRPVRRGDAGAGPFELREREATRLLLVRNAEWWGRRLGLGPGVERLEFLVVPSDLGRVDQLSVGVVDVGDQLGPVASVLVEEDPLLNLIGGDAVRVGLSGAVRGLESTSASQSLASLWLTQLR